METESMFRLSAYREVGESHIRMGKDCEDTAVTGRDPETGVAAAVVSDGAGSCRYAREGSEITAQAALKLLLSQFDALYQMPDADAAAWLLDEIGTLLENKAKSLACPVSELSATLVCAAMAPDGRYLYFHVGDGIIAACDAHGICRIVSQYYHEVARNYTTFVTVPGTAYNIGRGKGGAAAFLVTSDGPEYLMTFDAVWMTSQADLLLQMSVFFSRERMTDELEQLTAYYKELGMYDDASYAMVADQRMAGGVFDGMDEELRRMIFYLPERMPRRVCRQMHDCFRLLAEHSEGVPESRMTRALHTHRKRNTFRKLSGLLTSGVIGLHEGRYRF